jgi:hypothetical protein
MRRTDLAFGMATAHDRQLNIRSTAPDDVE